MHDVKCRICGRTFKSNFAKNYYCSPQCKVTGYRKKRLAWEALNPDYAHNHYMQRRANALQSNATP